MSTDVLIERWTGKWLVLLTEYVTYTFLLDNSMYGKEIYDFLVENLSPDVKKPTLYSILNRAEQHGLIEVSNRVEGENTRGTERVYYRLTNAGVKVLEKMRTQFSMLERVRDLELEVKNK